MKNDGRKHEQNKYVVCGGRRISLQSMRQDRIIVDLLWNFKSRRSIDRQTLRELVQGLRKEIVPVGVFVNVPKELVAELLEEGTIQMAQLHGQGITGICTGIKDVDRETADPGIFRKDQGRCEGHGRVRRITFTDWKRRNGKSV